MKNNKKDDKRMIKELKQSKCRDNFIIKTAEPVCKNIQKYFNSTEQHI